MEQADVVVVGAGLSGLVAARDLTRAGLAVVVLEAADRVGGRAMSETTVLGSRLDLGGQWIGHDHHRLAGLVDELGATRFAMHSPRVPGVADGARRLGSFSPFVLAGVAWLALLSLLRLSRRPERWAHRTIHDWLQKTPGRTRRLLEVAGFISWTVDLRRVSVPTGMSMIRSQGGLVTMLSSKGGAQDALVTEGVGFLADRLAADLGDAVRTSQRVLELSQDDDGVLVRTGTGELRARRVVLAVAPPVASSIQHSPALPPARSALERETFMGSVYKAVAVYPEPFWRARREAEMVFLDEPGCAVFDTTAPGGPGHLCLLVGGPEAEALDTLTTDERREVLLGRLAAHLGERVLAPAGWHEKAWHLDPFVEGGYLAMPDLGASAWSVPMASEPIGHVHVAGSESALDHPGYLDGAIEAGERAAREVVGLLTPR